MPIESPATSSKRPAHQPADGAFWRIAAWRGRAAASPFACLVRHFMGRLIRGRGNNGAAADTEFGAGPLLGLLAAPGGFLALLLLNKYSSLLSLFRGWFHDDLWVVSAPDKYLFVSVAMAVTGIVTVLKWDCILPNDQDYLNLVPLPVSPRAILLANAIAIAFVVVVFTLDVSAFSSVLFPLIISTAAQSSPLDFVRLAVTHAACVTLACVFTFCAVFSLFGIAAALLPRNAFRGISSWLRGLTLIVFLVLLFSSVAGARLLQTARISPDSPLHWLPPLWFVALYQNLLSRPIPGLARMAGLAWQSTLLAFGLAIAAYAASYRRRFASVLEGGPRPARQLVQQLLLRVLGLFAPHAAGFHRAAFGFAVRALLRSEEHRLCFAVTLGLGWLLAFQRLASVPAAATAIPAAAELEAALIAAYLLTLGLRVALALPVSLPAGWVFRSNIDPSQNETAAIARRIFAAFITCFVLAPSLALSVWRIGVAAALLHTFYTLAISALLVECYLAGYRAMPLGCPTRGFRHSLPLVCLLQILGFLAFVSLGAAIERWMFLNPWRFLLLPAVLGGAWLWNRRRVAGEIRDGLREAGMYFDNPPDPAMQQLSLQAE